MDIQSKLTELGGGALIGDLVLWGNRNSKISERGLENLASKYGLPAKYIPKLPSATEALRRAHTAMRYPQCLLKPVGKTSTSISIGVCKLQIDENQREFSGKHLGRTVFFTGSETFLQEEPHPALNVLEERYREFRSIFVTEDIRELIQAVVKDCDAISILESVKSNSRFIPPSGHDLFCKLRDLCHEVPGCDLSAYEITDSPANLRQAQKDAHNSLQIQICEAEQELEKLTEHLATAAQGQGYGPREATIKDRIAQFQGIRSKIGLLSDALRMKTSDLEERIEWCSAQMSELLGL